MCDILVVENEPATLGALVDRLEAAGYSVIGSGSGGEALEYLSVTPRCPRLVLFDLSTPTVEGWDFLERQRNDPTLAAIPIITMSASVSAVAGHGKDLQTKPLDLHGLLALIDKHF